MIKASEYIWITQPVLHWEVVKEYVKKAKQAKLPAIEFWYQTPTGNHSLLRIEL